jgi:CBS-domain-containing membrane protein
MKASDVMQKEVVTVTPETSLKDAVHLMVARRISGLPVVDEAGIIVGILAESDLLRRVELGTDTSTRAWRTWFTRPGQDARNYVRSHALSVGEVMTIPVTCVTPDTDLAEVVALMESRRIKRLPVLKHGRIAGIITRADLVRALESLLPQRDRRPIADAELRRRVLASLGEQRWTRRAPIEVRVKNGMVELVGLVTDEREREGIRVIAENTPGAQGVIDSLLWIERLSGIPGDPPVNASR